MYKPQFFINSRKRTADDVGFVPQIQAYTLNCKIFYLTFNVVFVIITCTRTYTLLLSYHFLKNFLKLGRAIPCTGLPIDITRCPNRYLPAYILAHTYLLLQDKPSYSL